MENRQILGFGGSILLLVGIFMPIVSLPFVGSLNYFQNGKGDGVIVLILAIVSLLLTLIRKYKLLWVTGLLSLGLMLFTFVNFKMRMREMENSMGNNPFGGLAKVALDTIQIQWGWAVLVLGALLLIVAAAMKNNNSYQEPTGF